jgi:glycerophosphoryl diester phosphodiesterase
MTAPFDLQGHRGARGLRAENTLPSFEAALDAGVTTIETDLHLTRDDVVVLCHDPRLAERIYRLAAEGDRPPVSPQPLVRQLSLQELRRYRADRNPDPVRFPDQQAVAGPVSHRVAQARRLDPFGIPTLDELFDLVVAYAGEAGVLAGKTDTQRQRASRVRFDLELKRVPFYPETLDDGFDGHRPGVLEERVVAAVRAAGVIGRTTVRSFDHRCVQLLRQMEPGLTGAVLVADTAPVDPAELARQAGAIIYCPSCTFLDADLVRRAHVGGVRVVPWTVNDPSRWQRLLDWGVDGVTTDYPDRLAEFLGNRGIAF